MTDLVRFGKPENPAAWARVDGPYSQYGESGVWNLMYALRNDVADWLSERSVECWWDVKHRDGPEPRFVFSFWFTTEQDAVEFKLRWG